MWAFSSLLTNDRESGLLLLKYLETRGVDSVIEEIQMWSEKFEEEVAPVVEQFERSAATAQQTLNSIDDALMESHLPGVVANALSAVELARNDLRERIALSRCLVHGVDHNELTKRDRSLSELAKDLSGSEKVF